MWCKDEDDFYPRRDRDRINRHFEVAVRALTEGDGAASYNYELVRILPTRLSNAAFLLWDSLPAAVQADYTAVKERLETFGQRQFMDRFRASLSARPRAPRESLEVYVAEIGRLVDEAFLEYGDKAQKEEKFRRFVAGLDPVLRAKCHEQGATDLEEAVIIAGRCEMADCMPVNNAYGNIDGVSAVHSVTNNGGLYGAVDQLTGEMREMRMELMRLGEENQRLKSSASSRATNEWSGDRSRSNGMCQCVCGGRGCQSRVFDSARRGRLPETENKMFQRSEHTSCMDVRGYNNSYTARSPARRSPSPARRWTSHEDDSRKRGVRFMSPGRAERRSVPGNGQ
ncbi:hypothetical protein HF521_014159 [Silurus meridionalis]|uniref:Retrotransposon gag domain-containing protein n=1 Tax=Silurus meridionalis TaxID=175797 RepID=A0A8T0A874_SILME|nr:hypothetical protein HF521_014159 [Silurus meridionalis]